MSSKKTTGRKKTSGSRKKSGAGNGSKEGRLGQRIPIQLLVDYQSNGNYLFDFCRDLGTGGVFIETKKPLEMNATVSLTFTIPDSKETLEAEGEVIWVQNEVPGKKLTPGMGVQFRSFNQDQRKVLEEFVSRYRSEEGKTSRKPA